VDKEHLWFKVIQSKDYGLIWKREYMRVGKGEEYPHIGGESFNILIMVRSWELERV